MKTKMTDQEYFFYMMRVRRAYRLAVMAMFVIAIGAVVLVIKLQ